MTRQENESLTKQKQSTMDQRGGNGDKDYLNSCAVEHRWEQSKEQWKAGQTSDTGESHEEGNMSDKRKARLDFKIKQETQGIKITW